MVGIQAVRASNSGLKELGPGLVAVFVGGTSGIGESTAREFVRNTIQPRVYLVGRNEARASTIAEELQKINPDGNVSFIRSDASLLKSVDTACDEIRAKEERVNVLFMSQGVLNMKQDVTPEGLDRKFSLHYYSRIRFASNLLPQLTTASKSGGLSRVISVLAAGTEGRISLDDLALKANYSLGKCATHAGTMNSFAAEELAAANSSTTYIHAYPGFVKTNLSRGLGPIMKAATEGILMLVKPWSVPLGESGERHLYAATSKSYPPKSQPEESAVVGSAGEKGSGAYLISWDGTPCGKDKIMKEYRTQGVGRQIWEHTLDEFHRICGSEDGKS
ncbi:MAG: hypothetical protein M1837_005349 [Sclerophora amabilis]|nr:MAG: hypothetical protein M1837_005349 [Sclerophora amabilis]